VTEEILDFPKVKDREPKPEEVIVWIYRALDGIKHELLGLRKQLTLFREAFLEHAWRK